MELQIPHSVCTEVQTACDSWKDKERDREDAEDVVREKGDRHTGGGSLPRPHTYVGHDTAQAQCVERNGIPEREEQPDDL